jgi:antitoxin (DNA-binding transcriptional repressor) of toxin-antitoxin stability system
MKAIAKELHFESKKLSDTVVRGDGVVITFSSKPCAKLVPYAQEKKTFDASVANELFGIWRDRDNMNKVDDYVRDFRKSRIS